MSDWHPGSWRNFKALHQPRYDDSESVDRVIERIKGYPPLVFAGEVRQLERELSLVCQGKAFILQGGDCAESFAEFHPDYVKDSFRVLLQMAIVLTFGCSLPVVKIGRIAGQFVKPRTSPMETRNGVTLPSYLGDMVNSMAFAEKERRADPSRMLQGYHQSTSVLNLLRAFAMGGYADLQKVHRWMLSFVRNSSQGHRYRELADRITEAVDFMTACGISGSKIREMREVNFYTSHEALLLPYEEAMTRIDSTSDKWYDVSAHMLWIGDRTKSPRDSHIEFVRGIENPIGIKIGPKTRASELSELIELVNPDNKPGRLTLFSRMGYDKIEDLLPPLIDASKSSGISVIWSCDPMHGNIMRSSSGYKTRHFDQIVAEAHKFFAICDKSGVFPGGIHLEMTGQDVTECTGGGQKIADENLADRYHTHCDPRLNASQSLEIAFLISDELKKRRQKSC